MTIGKPPLEVIRTPSLSPEFGWSSAHTLRGRTAGQASLIPSHRQPQMVMRKLTMFMLSSSHLIFRVSPCSREIYICTFRSAEDAVENHHLLTLPSRNPKRSPCCLCVPPGTSLHPSQHILNYEPTQPKCKPRKKEIYLPSSSPFPELPMKLFPNALPP